MDTAAANRVPADRLRSLVEALFVRAGTPEADAQRASRILVLQEMRGVVTHGLRRVASNLDGLIRGWINPSPEYKRMVDRDAVAVIDGDNGLGMLGSEEAMQLAIERASSHGISMVSVVNSNHFLSAAPYCLQAVERGMVGVVMSNTQASMGYPGVRGLAIGNNPLGFGVPAGYEFPVVFDSSLTTSLGQLERYRREGRCLPPYLMGLDADGRWTDDPSRVIDGGVPMPIGLHKGAGLALMVEMMTGVIAGGAFLSDLLPINRRSPARNGETQSCIAIDVAHFMEPEAFRRRASQMVEMLRGLSADAADPALVPGERAAQALAAAEVQGVAVPDDVASEINGWASRLGAPRELWLNKGNHA